METLPSPVNRRTVDLSQYPDLVVVYLGMRVNRIAGLACFATSAHRSTRTEKIEPVVAEEDLYAK